MREEGLFEYRMTRNEQSLDGLPGLDIDSWQKRQQ